MGFSAAISGGIMMTMIIVVLIMAIPAVINANITTSRAYSERAQLDSEYIKTSIQITDLQALPDTDIVNVTLSNDGSSKLWNYQKFNVLVTYDYIPDPLASPQRITENLDYAGITQIVSAAGSWSITGFIDDNIDPQILNPEESLTIRGRLNHDIAISAELVAVTISTDNGVIVSKAVIL
ncbi:putative flagellar protein FlaF [Candidatus Nitrososphaera gargensis Ga9.2]|uniref:Putative flagellar protein FlaF n=1 Tax=Nitrososphaera gargensis (strain Ga9.2) TaxID=1237085 RepID=K0IGJ3_NITGG|nr:flagellar protein FlaF [Candidatus Nitrososphaera gargensis]AFU57953.1 putative flagellar protein FlaF [Candidatus Nitrososphaera gargensis Ga9.2]